MKNINITKLFLCLTLVLGFTSCDEGGDPDPGQTALVEMAGDWVVDISVDGDVVGHATISTYNTADNGTTQMWLDDNNAYYGLKAKVNVNLNNKTFSGDDLPESYYDVFVTVTDGSIIENGTTAPSGTVVDSITFTAEFSDSPGVLFTHSGHRRTGFLEDE